MKTVVISGYFNPFHRGHLEYINAAKKLGDRLIVIVNNDYQQILKIGKIISNENDRVQIIEAIKGVDEVVLSIDKDKTVIETLKIIAEKYPSIIFANGGDRKTDAEVPESILSRDCDIEFISGIIPIIDSSTRINKNLGVYAKNTKVIEKLWGYELWIVNNSSYCGKILHINKGCCLSFHFHKIKDETFYVLEGVAKLQFMNDNENIIMVKGDIKHIPPNKMHRLFAVDGDVDIIEISTHHEDSDSIRILESNRPDLDFCIY